MSKNRKVFVCGTVLLLLSVLLQLAARKADGFAGWYVRTVYSLLVGALGRIFGLFPFSVSEVGLYLLLISALAAVFRFRKKKIQLLAGIYSPFTVEANYNKEMTAYNIPHTICHELSHLRGFMREEVRRDLGENSLFWSRFESRISEVSETVNDTYLKANRQSEGVKSYGRAVDLMLGWYRQQQGKNGGEIPKKIVLLTLE